MAGEVRGEEEERRREQDIGQGRERYAHPVLSYL
jgi:hypothetical protein